MSGPGQKNFNPFDPFKPKQSTTPTTTPPKPKVTSRFVLFILGGSVGGAIVGGFIGIGAVIAAIGGSATITGIIGAIIGAIIAAYISFDAEFDSEAFLTAIAFGIIFGGGLSLIGGNDTKSSFIVGTIIASLISGFVVGGMGGETGSLLDIIISASIIGLVGFFFGLYGDGEKAEFSLGLVFGVGGLIVGGFVGFIGSFIISKVKGKNFEWW